MWPKSSSPSATRRAPASGGRTSTRSLGRLVQRDVDALLGRRRRVNRASLGIDRPPALAVAVDHPALNAMNAGVLDRLFRRTEHDGLAARAQNTGSAIEQNHPIPSSAIRHGRDYTRAPLAASPPARSPVTVKMASLQAT